MILCLWRGTLTSGRYIHVICIGPGVFQQILQATGSMSPEERAEYLENCAELAQIHATGAHEGQTEVM